MPVKLEILTTLNDDDRRDIGKILSETCESDAAFAELTSIESLLSNNHWIFAGRFNDRIVGIVIATPSLTTDAQTKLIFAGVRKLTQRRGVMHQLFVHIRRWADSEQQSLAITDSSHNFAPALNQRDFVNHEEQWVYPAKP